ncbi:MAG TPA: hypothetical protein PK323_07690 [Bacteroidia bacterium]|nr:hypothetical protein [Bacteroidia bacterium]
MFAFIDDTIQVLLQRPILKSQEQEENSRLHYQLPSDFILENEEIENTFFRILADFLPVAHHKLIPIQTIYLADLKVDSGFISNNELNNISAKTPLIKLSYLALAQTENLNTTQIKDEYKLHWFSLNKLPALAFGVDEIIKRAFQELKYKLKTHAIAFELLPLKFTLGQLQKIYELILEQNIDKRNFRKQMLKKGFLTSLQERQKQVSHKRAQFFEFNKDKFRLLQHNNDI